MSKTELMRKIQELSFAKVETELFLDTHPECRSALEYYQKTVDALEDAMEEYQNTYGPIVAASQNGTGWSWVDGPWPWQHQTEGDVEGRKDK